MKKTCLFFLLVGLTFAALQVATVAAQTGMPGGQCDPNPACVMDDPNAIPCCGMNSGSGTGTGSGSGTGTGTGTVPAPAG